MPIPTPRTESHTLDLTGQTGPETAPRFACSGDLQVTVTNNHDTDAEVSIDGQRLYDERLDHGSGEAPVYSEVETPRTVPANGGSVTFGDGADADLGDSATFFRAVVEFDTAPSSGDMTVEYEQTNQPRRVVVDSL